METIYDGPNVNGNDVASVEPARARDAMHDFVIHGGADAAGESMMAEEIGGRTELGDRVADDVVQLLGG